MGKIKDSITTGIAIILGGVLAPNFYDVTKENYFINENKVVVSDAIFNDYIKEYKGEDKIKYVTGLGGRMSKVKINGTKYTSKDILVYPEACKRYGSLTQKIDSIKNVREEDKLENKTLKVKGDLEILKK